MDGWDRVSTKGFGSRALTAEMEFLGEQRVTAEYEANFAELVEEHTAEVEAEVGLVRKTSPRAI